MQAVARYLLAAQEKIRNSIDDRPCAIYGAGVYGSYIATRIEGKANLKAFIDRNPHMWGQSEFGIPVVGPDRLPREIETIYAGVNPKHAENILSDISEWRDRTLRIVYLD
jgi:FlaA1/EpsC-like NDP-sugar epimerase